MQRLREEAARRGTTMSQLVEAGLRRVLADHATYEAHIKWRPSPSADLERREGTGRHLEPRLALQGDGRGVGCCCSIRTSLCTLPTRIHRSMTTACSRLGRRKGIVLRRFLPEAFAASSCEWPPTLAYFDHHGLRMRHTATWLSRVPRTSMSRSNPVGAGPTACQP